MPEYVEREAAIRVACKGCNKEFPNEHCEPADCYIQRGLFAIPAADVAPVRRGEWVPGKVRDTWGDEMDWFRCSHCGAEAGGRCPDDEFYSVPVFSNYCPKCGAEMTMPSKEAIQKWSDAKYENT